MSSGSFTNIFDINFPPDTQQAKLLGDDIRKFKLDIQERISAMSGFDAAKPPLGSDTQPLKWLGFIYFATDTHKIYQWNGGGWNDITSGVIDLSLYALINSPVFTGDPQAPDQPDGDNDESIANTKFVQRALTLLRNGWSYNYQLTYGWIKFPTWLNSLLVQWGRGPSLDAAAEFSASIAFPVAFPNNVFIVNVTMAEVPNTQSNDCWYQVVGTPSTTGFTYFKQGTGGTEQTSRIYWVAIGN